MRAATFLTTTAMGCFVLALGCRDRAVDGPTLRPTVHERTTTIPTPTVAPQSAEPLPSPARKHSEPVMPTPPIEEEPKAPALGPEPAPAAPRAPPSRYEDRCGRPLVA